MLQFLSRARRRSHTAKSEAAAAPLVEPLESRTLLSGTVVVTPAFLGDWAPRTTDGGGPALTASVAFVNGPATPPLGSGSVQLSVGSNGDGAAEIRNSAYAGTKLSSLTSLGYSTYVSHDGSGGQAPYILLNLDLDGNGSVDDQLFFEPVYQSSTFFPSNPQAHLAVGQWQTWDALNGGWWSANGLAGANPGTGVKSLAAYIAAEPNATIVNSTAGGGLRFVAGFGAPDWDNFVGNVDAVNVGVNGDTTTYDFELMPSSKEQCKDGGWTYVPGAKNQGQCVSMFASKKKAGEAIFA